MRKVFGFLFPVWLVGYSLFSFSQTDPNLVLSSNAYFWNIQQWLWQTFLPNRLLTTVVYISLILLLFGSYICLLMESHASQIHKKDIVSLWIASLLVLLPSYPALSHDIYNYLFNAKMVLVYHANPHVSVALDYPQDPWLRFMHNVHTPAPYGYGFTLLSLLPYWIGHGYLQGEVLIFRLWMIVAYIGVIWIISKIKPLSLYRFILIAFNPLLLLEMVGTIHNDLLMMLPALGAVYCVERVRKTKSFWWGSLGVLLLALSASIKYASIALIGALIASVVLPWFSLYEWSVFSLWSPLLTNQSQRFLPWYLSWTLVFLPLVEKQSLITTMIATSFAGLLSYLFIFWQGSYSQTLLWQRTILLFGIPIIWSGFEWIRYIVQRSHRSS